MAIVTAIKSKTQSKVAMGKVIDYVSPDKKTMFHDDSTGQGYNLISGQNCVAETAFHEFMATKIQHGKDSGVFYKHFVQSFKPGEVPSPQEILQMGIELAKYFESSEVLVATHIDADHWHNHLIVNSVNAETGLKIQFNEKSLNELRLRSDEICVAYGLQPLKPYEKGEMAGINAREYRVAEKGQSWKFKLMSAIDHAMNHSSTKEQFIKIMGQMGYGVKWEPHHKYITYTTPEGQKCRDNRLHESKYLKSEMEECYAIKRTKAEKSNTRSKERLRTDTPTGKSLDETGSLDRELSNSSTFLWNPAGGSEQSSAHADRDSQTPSTHAGGNIQAADMGRLGEGHSAEDRDRNKRSYQSDKGLPRTYRKGDSQSDIHYDDEYQSDDYGQDQKVGSNPASPRHVGVEAPVQMDGHRSDGSSRALGVALALEDLLVDKSKKNLQEKEPKQKSHGKKNKQGKSHERGWDMSL
ncbi:MAG: relaxase/mobilization nuclease domain-containing protein [Oscillospiraceae bacterium]|nr:relaxase/mobilization nuclease domain-containing protein [Oscillospiraceae bacterium]